MEDRITSFGNLQDFATSHSKWLFRGQHNPDWSLETTLERAAKRCGVPTVEYERKVVHEFPRHAHSYLPRVPEQGNTLEWLALMQHYGAPTRLLDFTNSFWIALFFAFEFATQDCVIWAINPASLGEKSGDLNHKMAENIKSGSFTDNKLYQDVPYYSNERLAIQKGAFIFSMNTSEPFHDLLLANNKEYIKLHIANYLFPQIREWLNAFNCTSRVLFHGIDGFARSFQNHG